MRAEAGGTGAGRGDRRERGDTDGGTASLRERWPADTRRTDRGLPVTNHLLKAHFAHRRAVRREKFQVASAVASGPLQDRIA